MKPLETLCARYAEKIRLCRMASWLTDHLLWMLEGIPQMTDTAKANRWMGFVQGVMFSEHMYSIDELREHVRLAASE